MSRHQVLCTGIGLVSPLGVGAEASWLALLNSACGIMNLRDDHSFEGNQSKVAAYVPNEELNKKLSQQRFSYIVKNAKQLSRSTILAMVAADEALLDAKLIDTTDNTKLHLPDGLRCGVSVGQGMIDFEDVYENAKLVIEGTKEGRSGFKRLSPFFITRVLMNMSASHISMRYNITGPNHCTSTACATGVHSIGDAFNFIRNGQVDMMVCGSTEASINSIAMAGFERLRALSTQHNGSPRAASRPFDRDRNGFVMGEGAGIVVLESKESAEKRKLDLEKNVYCEILGFGQSADAHHLTAPSPDGRGAVSCMRNALTDAALLPDQITHINAHATSTPLGDDIECNAIEEVFYGHDTARSDRITVTSCKGAVGHLLGGAGSVETVFSILSCRNGQLPPTLNLENPLCTPRQMLKIISGEPMVWSNKDRRLIKNSFGFGGTNASLVISNTLHRYN